MSEQVTDIVTKPAASPLQDVATQVRKYATQLLNDQRAKQFYTQLSIMAKNEPKLASCTPESVLTALIACVHLDLMPNTPEQYAFVIPYTNRRTNKTEAQFQLGYKGVVELAYRSNKITLIDAGLVFPEDEFDYSIGEHENFTLKPDMTVDRTKLDKAIAAYAWAKLDNGEKAYAVMVKQEIDKVRESAKASSTQSPWNTWPEAMAKKTVVKRLLKYLPSSAEDNRFKLAAEYDSWAEAGKLRYDPREGLVQSERITLPEQADESEIKEEANAITDRLLAESQVVENG